MQIERETNNHSNIMISQEIKELLLPQVVNAAVRAGAAIMQHYNTPKEAREVIEEANLAAQNAIKEALGPTRIPILSEEGREMLFEERQNWEMFWLVDPLDGTLEFINRNNEFTVNIALMHLGEAVAGVIYVPYLKKLYFAGKGAGAYLCQSIEPQSEANYSYAQITESGVQLPQIAHRSGESVRIALSRSHTTPETLDHIETLKSKSPNIELVEQGSSYKFCMLAEGGVDYYIRTSPTYEWDTAAGELILSESGGTTSGLQDGDYKARLCYNKEDLQNPWFKCNSKHCTL